MESREDDRTDAAQDGASKSVMALEELSALDLQAIALLSYAAPPQPLPTNLKQRLFAQLSQPEFGSIQASLDSGVSPQDCAQEIELSPLFELLSQSIETLKQASKPLAWQPVQGADGFEAATWKIDRAYNYVALFLRAKTRAHFPLHRHNRAESLRVLGGDLSAAERAYGAGDRILSQPDTCHALDTEAGCLVLAIVSVEDLQLSY